MKNAKIKKKNVSDVVGGRFFTLTHKKYGKMCVKMVNETNHYITAYDVNVGGIPRKFAKRSISSVTCGDMKLYFRK